MRYIKFFCLLTIFSLKLTSLSAQKQGNNWFFGNQCGLDFNVLNAQVHPTYTIAGKLNTIEGCSSYSDAKTGKLLFYTDGVRLYDAKHNLVTDTLRGNTSSTQSAIGIQHPLDSSVFFLFTMDAVPLTGGKGYDFTYSILRNVSPAGGILLLPNEVNMQLYGDRASTVICDEKLTATADGGGGYWIIIKEYSPSGTKPNYVLFRLDGNGQLSQSPALKMPAPFYSDNFYGDIGSIKFSPDGKKLAVANDYNKCELYDFDKYTGVISNQRILDISSLRPYGLEFSPDASRLYISSEDLPFSLYQFDLLAGSQNTADIQSSRVLLASGNEFHGQLQLGPNGKIYFSPCDGYNYLNSIEYPNALGTACNYKQDAVRLDGRAPGKYTDRGTRYGLPSYVTSFFTTLTIKASNCGYTYHFTKNTTCPDPQATFRWDFGDGTIATGATPTHTYTSVGNYQLVLTVSGQNCSETIKQLIEVRSPFSAVTKVPDFSTCSNVPLQTGVVPKANVSYSWQPATGLSNADVPDPVFSMQNNGKTPVSVSYILRHDTVGCTFRDTIKATVLPLPTAKLGRDTTLCDGSTMLLSASSTTGIYRWQDRSKKPTYLVSKAGMYILVDSNSCGLKADTINVAYERIPQINLGRDTTLCEKETLLLDATNPNASYSWQDASMFPTYTVDTAGTYSVVVSNQFCGASASVKVQYTIIPLELGNDTTLCPGKSLLLDASSSGASYVWQDATTQPVYTIQQPGSYWVKVSVGRCSKVDSIAINYDSTAAPVISLGRDTTLCEGESIQLYPAATTAPIQWQDASYTPSYLVTTKGIYWAQATTFCNRTRDSIDINYIPLPRVNLGPDAVLCEGEYLTLDVANPGAEYVWQDSSGRSTFKVETPGKYWVRVKSYRCPVKSDTIRIKQEQCYCAVFIPNAFTPNDDQLNETFAPKSDCDFSAYLFRVYDRWGNLIFESNEKSKGWDGTLNERPAQMDVYAYQLEYKFKKGERIKRKFGKITLVR